jgi:small subunit ribosomal protein S17
MSKKLLQGIVVSDKMQKTVVVEVESIKEHPKYRRKYKSHKRYKAHDQNQEYHTGDKVVIEETTPISKDKSWIVKNKI